jgi:hypothetical protein
MHTKALLQDLEVLPLTPSAPSELITADRHRLPLPGETISVYFSCAGPKIYMDAAWKTAPGQVVAKPGLDIYLAIPDALGSVVDVLITASSSPVPSAIQAEAQVCSQLILPRR